MKVWCVAWLERPQNRVGAPLPMQWCATFRGRKHADDEVNVRTACGFYVVLPVGGEKRRPTCDECLQRVARRRANRKARK